MKRNMGNTDKAIRVAIALIIVGLYFGNIITGILAILLLVLAGIFVFTSLISFCPLYLPFGFKTCKTKK